MLDELLAPAVEALGYEFWGHLLLKQGKYSLLRVYIEKPNGVDVDDCAKASHQINGVLAIHDPIKSEYTLEVSSPGLDRPLFTLKQYERYIGHTIKLRLKIPKNGQRNFQGMIKKVEGEKITLQEEKIEHPFLFEEIDRAHIVPDFGD